MSNENKNNIEPDFEDFADDGNFEIEMDSDLSQIDEEAVEKALKNIASQMEGAPEEFAPTVQEAEADTETISEAPVEEAEKVQEKDSENKEDSKEDVQVQEQEIKSEDIDKKEELDENKPNDNQAEEPKSEDNKKSDEKLSETNAEDGANTQLRPEVSKWEEIDNDNNVVKKYIVYISKDFVPIIDELSIDKRSAYINDAIQLKIDAQDEERQNVEKRNAMIHFIVAIVVVILFTPIALIIANKAILATFDNYKYSQDNFEKLYVQRFEKDKAFMRSLQYNKEYEKRVKKGIQESN